MVTLDQLKAIYNHADAERHFTYLNNKHTGGNNNSKGNTFENYFAIYQFAKLFNEGESHEHTFFSAQALSFIDDLAIELQQNNLIKFFQIKDIQNLEWHTGNHPIEKDFEIQYNIATNNGKNTKLYLIVSRKELYDELVVDIPKTISAYTEVIHFNTATSINNLIRNNSDFKDELIKMCAISNPSSDKLDALGTIILGAWDGTDKTQISMKSVLEYCYNENPNYIKGFDGRISVRLEGIFNSIAGFNFTIENGYVIWNYNNNTDSGTLPYPIGTLKFTQWENDIINLGAVNSFETIESFLS